jgi:hypothetical protein
MIQTKRPRRRHPRWTTEVAWEAMTGDGAGADVRQPETVRPVGSNRAQALAARRFHRSIA